MPAQGQHNEQASQTPDPSPELSAEHGENPARYLQANIRPDYGDGTTGQLIFARIRGLETVALCRYWAAIERRLAAREDRDPRPEVLRAIAARERHLEEHGEGLPQAGLTPPERRERATDRATDSVAVLLDEDGNEVSWSRQRGATAEASR